MKPTAVVPLMHEAWELRTDQVDVSACAARGILVMATDEGAEPWRVFEYVGPLAVKMVLSAGVELYRSQVAVIGADKLAVVAARWLEGNGAIVRRIESARLRDNAAELEGCDAVVMADLHFPRQLLGTGGELSAEELALVAPGAAVIQFAGGVDAPELAARGFTCLPEHAVAPGRMGWTFSELGPAPLIRLHAMGLKVGEVCARARLSGLSLEESERLALQRFAGAQRVPEATP